MAQVNVLLYHDLDQDPEGFDFHQKMKLVFHDSYLPRENTRENGTKAVLETTKYLALIVQTAKPVDILPVYGDGIRWDHFHMVIELNIDPEGVAVEVHKDRWTSLGSLGFSEFSEFTDWLKTRIEQRLD